MLDAERAFLIELGGDCDLPAGAHAVPDGLGVRLRAMLAAESGTQVETRLLVGADGPVLGRSAAMELREAISGARPSRSIWPVVESSSPAHCSRPSRCSPPSLVAAARGSASRCSGSRIPSEASMRCMRRSARSPNTIGWSSPLRTRPRVLAVGSDGEFRRRRRQRNRRRLPNRRSGAGPDSREPIGRRSRGRVPGPGRWCCPARPRRPRSSDARRRAVRRWMVRRHR